MFGLFRKKEGTEIKDKVFMSDEAKQAGLGKLLQAEPEAVLLCWFPDTRSALQQQFPGQAARILDARQAGPDGEMRYFAEHYPQYGPEQELFRSLLLNEAVVYSSLTEPLFQLFGGQKIIHLATQMGFKPDEAIENKLVSSAIENAQKRIDARVTQPILADSQAVWVEQFQLLYPKPGA